MKRCEFRAALTMLLGGLMVGLVVPASSSLADFQVGAASVDITPSKAVALWGQFGLRLSTTPETPLTANAVVLRSGDAQTTFVSLDLLQLPEGFVRAISDAVSKKDDSIDVEHLVLTATQTFILQMSGFGSYLPTERAQAGGHYSAVPQSNNIGPERGQVLVDKTVEIIHELWK